MHKQVWRRRDNRTREAYTTEEWIAGFNLTASCFLGCGREGHLVRTCPEKIPGKRAEHIEVTAGTSTNVETVKQGYKCGK